MCIVICCSFRRVHEVRSRVGETCCAAEHACVHLLGRNRRGQHVKGRMALSVPSSRVEPLQHAQRAVCIKSQVLSVPSSRVEPLQPRLSGSSATTSISFITL